MPKDMLTEDQVIEGVINYFNTKGSTKIKEVKQKADTAQKQRGIDLRLKLKNEKGNGNNYFIEAKGTLRADGAVMRSSMNTNFRWAISQIILRITVDSTRYNYIYGIAVPNSEIPKCVRLIKNNWALKLLKVRLYGSFYDSDGKLTAIEYSPKNIYKQ